MKLCWVFITVSNCKRHTQMDSGMNFSTFLFMHMKKDVRNCSWLMNFYISEQNTSSWDVARNVTDPRAVPHHIEKIIHFDCKHIPSRLLLSELVSRQGCVRLYSVEEGQNYETSGQLLCSPVLNDSYFTFRDSCAIWLIILIWRYQMDKKWMTILHRVVKNTQSVFVTFWLNPSWIV